MQSNPIIKNRIIPLSVAALLAGMSAYSLIACDSDKGTASSGAMVTLTSPKGGETFKVGDSLRVKWSVKDVADAPDAMDVELSPDGGKSWGYIHSGSISNTMLIWGNYAWAVKDSLLINGAKVGLIGKQALIRVKPYVNPQPATTATLSTAINITAPTP
ncbi:MAG: hypothetical protein JWP91_3611 [Fibrobacteres bacterium]|nr:hypothetical protein [Fibrobacterota bacterium]